MALKTRLRASALDALLGEHARALQTRWHRTLGPGEKHLEVYFRVDDPYSYLLAQVLPALCERYDLKLQFILLGPPFGGEGLPSDPLRAYAVRDATGLALQYQFAFPPDAKTPRSDHAQLAHRILAVDREALTQIRIAEKVCESLFGGAEQTLMAIEKEHGAADEAMAKRQSARHLRLLQRRGHYQSGMLRHVGEWYWGIERLAHLERKLSGGPLASQILRRRHNPPPIEKPDHLEFFFSFRSPYSYLAIEPIASLCRKHDLNLTIRPVLPMVMRGLAVPFAKRLYIVRDCKREALRLGIPFGRICDPLGPGIGRAMALFHHAEERGFGLDFIRSATRGSWSEGLDLASDTDMEQMATRAGLRWNEARDRLGDSHWKAKVEANREALDDLGLWGVPSFSIGHWSAWGQDRIGWLDEQLTAGN